MAFKVPNPSTTTNKCIRFPDNMIEEVENNIKGTNCTFSAFVIAAVQNALDELKKENE